MPRHMTTPLLLRFCAVSLTTFALAGCDLLGIATRPPTLLTRVLMVQPEIDPESLSCPQRPQPPDAGGTQADVAVYLREAIAWGDSCEAKLADLREILRPSNN